MADDVMHEISTSLNTVNCAVAEKKNQPGQDSLGGNLDQRPRGGLVYIICADDPSASIQRPSVFGFDWGRRGEKSSDVTISCMGVHHDTHTHTHASAHALLFVL